MESSQAVVLYVCDFDETFIGIQNLLIQKFRNQTKGLVLWLERKFKRLEESFLDAGIPIEFILDKEVIYATLYDQIQNNSHPHNDEDFGFGAFQKFFPKFMGNFVLFSQIPRELLSDKQFIAEHLRFIGSEPFLKYMDKDFIAKEKKFLSRIDSNMCTTLGYKFRDDEEFMLDMSTHHYGGGLQFLSERLKHDRNFMLKVSQNSVLKHVPNDLIEDDDIRLNWFMKDYTCFKSFGDEYVRNLDFIRKCLKLNRNVISFVPEVIIEQHEDFLAIKKEKLELLEKLKCCTTAHQVIDLMSNQVISDKTNISIVPPLEMNETLLLIDKYPDYIKILPQHYFSDWNLLKKMKSIKEKKILSNLKVSSIDDNNKVITLLEMNVNVNLTISQSTDREFLLKLSKQFGHENNILSKASPDLLTNSDFVKQMISYGPCNFQALKSASKEQQLLHNQVCGIYQIDSLSNLDELKRVREKRLCEYYYGVHLAKHLDIDMDYTFYYWPMY